MLLSARLKKWLVDNAGVKANATDDEFRKAMGENIANGKLTLETVKELTTAIDDKNADDFGTLLKELSGAMSAVKDLIHDDLEKSKAGDEAAKKGKKKPPVADDDEEEDEEEEEVEEDDEEEEPAKGKKKGGDSGDTKGQKGKKTVTKKAAPTMLEKMLVRISGDLDGDDADGERSPRVRVKAAVEQYESTKSAAIYPNQTEKGRPHPLAGKRVMDYNEPGKGRAMDTPSERDKAIAGAFGKFLISSVAKRSKTLAFQTLPEHDRDVLAWALEHEKWGGSTDGGDFADIKDRKLTPHEQKALIDDATSGGLEAAPIVFDDQIIQTPLLYGELYPLVNTVPLERGRRVEGVATGTVTGGWGGVDDTEIALFDTTSYVTAFDTTIFRWEGAVRIGLDFLSDTPIDFGAHLTAQYGERLLEDLDDVIATGNGTTQPEGIMNKAGATSINFGATTTLGNYESLRFGVAKPEHRANLMNSAVFCGTETSYMRARAIPVGASDARRLGGSNSTVGGVSDYGNYTWMGMPYKINESLENNQIFYAILARYRMYRRRGLNMRMSTEGDTLTRRNEMLVVATARYGGQMERGAVIARTTTAPT